MATTTKRFGARYGGGVKHDFAKIEALQRKKYKCPYCHSFKVKRIAVGIWHCRKCNAKFTGKAYTVPKKVVIKEEIKKGETEPEEIKKEEKPKEIKKEPIQMF